MIEIELADGEKLEGRLCLPLAYSEPVKTLVVFVQGTGPGTWLNKRKTGSAEFNYFDYYADAFNDRGIAFFSYNKRGVTIGEKAPWFDQVDREKFRKVVPSVEVQDLAIIVDKLQADARLSEAKVALLGWSEGTMIAALVAEKFPDKVDALLLAGYAHENIYDIIAWQFSGVASMLNLNPTFDKDGDNRISQEEYESGEDVPSKFRQRVMQNASFDLLDATGDGMLEAEDFAKRSRPFHSLLLHNTAQGNEDWIWENYFRISVPWLREHFTLEPNKTRLTRLDMPIYIFHGTDDAHVDVNSVKDLKQRFDSLGKTNLQTFVFEQHDHDLNFLRWVMHDDLPEGIAKILDVASALNGPDE